MKSSPVHIKISNDIILQTQIIWTNTIAKIEDNITWQKQFYWLEYKSQLCIYLSLNTNTGTYIQDRCLLMYIQYINLLEKSFRVKHVFLDEQEQLRMNFCRFQKRHFQIIYFRYLYQNPNFTWIVGSSIDRVKTMTIKLVFVASPLGTQHQGERAKTSWLGMRIMCPSGATCLSAHSCFQWTSTIKIQLSVLV